MKTKYKTGDTVFVVDHAEYVTGNMIKRIPLGKAVKITDVAVLKAKKSKPATRYNVAFDNVKICWLDEERLSSAIIDIGA